MESFDIKRALAEDLKKIKLHIRFRHSLWVLWSIIPFIGGAFAFFNLSLKVGVKRTALWGLFYLIPLVLVISGTSIISDKETVSGIAVLFWISAMIHAFVRRNDYLKNEICKAWGTGNIEKESSQSIEPVEKTDIETADSAEEIDVELRSLDELSIELNSLIGLKSVKEDVAKIIDSVKFEKMRGVAQSEDISNHLVFYGNPGTGKTTVARLIAQMYGALGILSKGHLIETDRAGLIGSFIGQTEEKVGMIVKKALGVIFHEHSPTPFS